VGTRATLAHATVTTLSRYSWPGNVREPQNVMSALAVAAPARGQVRASLLPSVISGMTAGATSLAEARTGFERRFIELALARAGGKRARAARELGLSRQGLMKNDGPAFDRIAGRRETVRAVQPMVRSR
jgi:transcriptional regulator with PAS, ATPase and Fis domain